MACRLLRHPGMTLQHHSLVQEFPEFRDAIHRLKVGDPTFRTLFEEYDELDKRIYRIEQDIEPVCDELCAQLKRRRLYLKDRLLQIARQEEVQTP